MTLESEARLQQMPSADKSASKKSGDGGGFIFSVFFKESDRGWQQRVTVQCLEKTPVMPVYFQEERSSGSEEAEHFKRSLVNCVACHTAIFKV